MEHTIELEPGAQPPSKRPYRLSPLELDELKRQLEQLTSQGYAPGWVGSLFSFLLFVSVPLSCLFSLPLSLSPDSDPLSVSHRAPPLSRLSPLPSLSRLSPLSRLSALSPLSRLSALSRPLLSLCFLATFLSLL